MLAIALPGTDDSSSSATATVTAIKDQLPTEKSITIPQVMRSSAILFNRFLE